MRLLIKIVLICALTTSAMGQLTPVSPVEGIRSKSPTLKAFTNAKIFISPEKKLENAIVLFKDGYILKVGIDIEIPQGAEIINLAGYTVYPGFIDPYTEYGLPKRKKSHRGGNRSLKFDGTRKGGNSWNDAIHSEVNWVSSFEPNKKEAEKLLNSGFTTVHSVSLDGIFRGRGFVALLGDDIPNNLILKPYSYQFASFSKGRSKQEYPNSLMGTIALIRQTFLDIDWYQKAHSAFSKNKNQDMPEFNSSIEALANFKNEKMIFESDDLLSLLRAKRISEEFKTTFIYIGSGQEYTLIDEVKNITEPLILPVNFPDAPSVNNQYNELDVSLATLRHWETAPSNPSILEQNNIKFAFTTYNLENKSDLLPNIRKAVKRGLTPKTALASLTVTPARLCGVANQVGTIESNKLANFIITDGDIFDSETKIYSTWVLGTKYEQTPMPAIDFSGNYTLSFNELTYELTIKGKPTKPSGEIKFGEEPIKLDHVSISLEELFFSLKIDTSGISGVLRFSGRKQNEKLTGHVTLPNGNIINWTALKTSEYIKDENDADDSDSTKIEEEFKPIAKLTFPNRSFGYETKPIQENVLIKNATVWTSEAEGILETTDVLVVDGKFAQIGKNLQANKNTKVIDATGKHLTAGVIDEHSHIAASGNINECTEAITAETKMSDIINNNDINIYRQLAGGVTACQTLHGSCNPIGGQAQVIKHKWGSTPEELKFDYAPPTIKFALGENVKRSSWGNEHKVRYPQTRMGVETIIKDEFQTAREYENDWQIYNSLNKKKRQQTIPPRKDIELDAVVDVLNSNMFIHCHSYVQSEILMLMRLAEEFDFRVWNFTHILEGYKVAPEMAKHGATASSFSDWWAYKFEVYDAIPYNVALMTEKGVISSVNSDNGDLARRLNQEAGKCVKYGGMTQEEAIKLCTINPAIQLKIEDRVGSIKVGKDADFVIWNGNPLSIYSKAEQTWIEGAKYFSLEKDLKLREDTKTEKYALLQKIIKSGEGKNKSKKHDMKWNLYDNNVYLDQSCGCIESEDHENN